MTAAVDGYCFRALPDYRLSTACDRIILGDDIATVTAVITFFGVSTTAQLLTFTNSAGPTETRTTTFSGSRASDFVAYSIIPQVTLVRRAQDVSAAGEGGGGGGSKPPNAAGPGRARAADSGAQWAFLVSICAIATGSVFVFAL